MNETNTDCRMDCVCKARTVDEAVKRAAQMVGNDAEAAISLLRLHGWRLQRDGA